RRPLARPAPRLHRRRRPGPRPRPVRPLRICPGGPRHPHPDRQLRRPHAGGDRQPRPRDPGPLQRRLADPRLTPILEIMAATETDRHEDTATFLEIHRQEIERAARNIASYTRRTPTLTTDLAENLLLKPECFQVTGSFKA